MRRRRFGSPGGASRLDHDDRLGQRHFTRRREERPRVSDRLHVHDNALGVGIVAQVVDQVAPAHVQHRADRDKGAEANVLLQAPIQYCGAQCAALADEPHLAPARHGAGKGGVQPAQRRHHPQAVRPDDAHVAASGVLHDLPFQLCPRCSGLLEARRDDDRPFHACFHAFSDQVRDGRGRCGDHRQLHPLRHRCHVGISFDPQHARALGVHRKYRPPKWIADHVPKHSATNAAWVLRRADQRHVLGRKDGIERLALVM